MKAAIFFFTRKGAGINTLIRSVLEQQGYLVDSYTKQKFISGNANLKDLEPDLKSVVGTEFSKASLLIFIGACGIAIRAIAPYVQDKQYDPAVICIDERGNFVIPLLSGHIGGANRFARNLAACLRSQKTSLPSQPIITTATDINGLIGIDEWAKLNHLYIGDMDAAKKISALLVDGESVGLYSDFKILGEIPEQFCLDTHCETGVCISFHESQKPFPTSLNLIPQIVVLGIGCKKGISAETIEELVIEVLEQYEISPKAVTAVASIDLKKDEKGLHEFITTYNLPVIFYSADELKQVSGHISSSNFVEEITGVDNVCERAALLASQKGILISPKTVKNGVTVALARKEWSVKFNYS